MWTASACARLGIAWHQDALWEDGSSHGPHNHVDVTWTCNTSLGTDADGARPFMEMTSPDGRGLFQKDDLT